MKRRFFLKAGLAGAGAITLAQNAWALKYYPQSSGKKIAVIYGTWCGSSRDAAVWISEGMGGIADVFDVRENPDPAGFEHLVIGGSIRSNVTPDALQNYIHAHQDDLKTKVRGYFAVCGNMQQPPGPEQTTKFIDNHLAKLCSANGLPSQVFLGRITKSLMEPEVAKSMDWVQDYDNLKRPECLAFGKEVLESLS